MTDKERIEELEFVIAELKTQLQWLNTRVFELEKRHPTE